MTVHITEPIVIKSGLVVSRGPKDMEYIFLLENCIYPVGIVGMLTQGMIRNHDYSRYDRNFYSVKTPYPLV